MEDAPTLFIGLALTAGLTSFLTSALGAGGGVMLLAIMAQVLPPAIIIPVHGMVQLGSNAGRAVLSWRSIDWQIILAFIPGVLVGGLIGSLVLVNLPPATIYLSIAGFTLYLCWGPPLPRRSLGRSGSAVLGAVTTFLTLFVGATGPLVGAFIKQKHADKFATVSTFATAMSVQHIMKAGVFQFAGFDLTPWLWLIAAMIGCGLLGTWLGLQVLKRFPEQHFATTFRIMLSLLALRLIWQAVTAGD